MRLRPLTRLRKASSLRLALVLLPVLGLVLLADPVQAQGFGVYEQGTCAMARAGATVATGCDDGSSIFFNPANVPSGQSVTASLGATVIAATGEFTYDYAARAPYTGVEVELENDPIPIPHGYVTYGVNRQVALGLGVYVPYGLETNWPTRLPDGSYFDGAFEGFENRVQAIYVQPTVSYQLTPRLHVGAGPIVAVSSVELQQLLDLSQQQAVPGGPTFGQLGVPFHTAFARSRLEANTELGYGANFGLSYDATDRLSLGVRFTTPITVSYEGDAQFSQIATNLTVPADLTQNGQVLVPAGTPVDGLLQPQFSNGSLTAQSIETEFTFPMQLVGGVSVEATDKLTLLADYQYTGWSAFDQIRLNFEKLGTQIREENYNDTHAVRLGAQYEVVDELTARAGYLYHTAAAPDEVVTPLLPESDRNQGTLGLGWRPVDMVEVNVSYQLLLQNDRRGRVRGAQAGESPTTSLNQGVYSFGANLFGTTLTLHL